MFPTQVEPLEPESDNWQPPGCAEAASFPPFLPGNAMIHSSHRDRKTKAITEVLAMIPDVPPELVPHRPRQRGCRWAHPQALCGHGGAREL
jgi:hypothetical protein